MHQVQHVQVVMAIADVIKEQIERLGLMAARDFIGPQDQVTPGQAAGDERVGRIHH